MSSIDVVIPNYNYGQYLSDAVESVLDQDVSDLRILIMDNASTDNSVEIATELAGKDRRIEVLARKRNVGLVASLNEGNEWAGGEYLISLSADDLLPPGALSRALRIFQTDGNVVAAFGRCLFFHDDETPVIPSQITEDWAVESGGHFIERFLTTHMVTLSPVVRTCIQKDCGPYRQDAVAIDAEMWLRWACHGDIASTQAPQAIQRLHETNISGAGWRDPVQRFRQAIMLRDTFFAHEGGSLPQCPKLKRKSCQAVGKDAYWSAWSHLARGRVQDAARLFGLAFRLYPRAAILPPVDQLGRYQDLMPRLKKTIPFADMRLSR